MLFISFLLGFIIGAYIKGMSINNKDWCMFKWDNTIFGYRPLMIGTTIRRNDKIIMGLHFDSDRLPEEGIEYSKDLN
jgi:hypothetical protein